MGDQRLDQQSRFDTPHLENEADLLLEQIHRQSGIGSFTLQLFFGRNSMEPVEILRQTAQILPQQRALNAPVSFHAAGGTGSFAIALIVARSQAQHRSVTAQRETLEPGIGGRWGGRAGLILGVGIHKQRHH